jgi:hypothetical protein
LSALEPPQDVQDWLKDSQGTWELSVNEFGDLGPQPQTSELAAGGKVLITKGKQLGTDYEFVSVLAWEPANKKLVTNWYNSLGTHTRTESDLLNGELKGTVRGTTHEGQSMSGTVTSKKVDDDTMETVYQLEIGGNTMSFTITAKRQK